MVDFNRQLLTEIPQGDRDGFAGRHHKFIGQIKPRGLPGDRFYSLAEFFRTEKVMDTR